MPYSFIVHLKSKQRTTLAGMRMDTKRQAHPFLGWIDLDDVFRQVTTDQHCLLYLLGEQSCPLRRCYIGERDANVPAIVPAHHGWAHKSIRAKPQFRCHLQADKNSHFPTLVNVESHLTREAISTD